jgi:ribonuclease HI
MLHRLIRRNSKNSKNSIKEAKIYPSTEYTLNFDGASKGNPGLSGAGAVIYKNGKEIWSSHKFVGYKTNNQAEYSGLILGLKGAITLGITSLSVLGDSLLVINQVNNIYKVRSECLHELYKEAQALKTEFDFIEFNHVYREYNKRADELSNLALENITDLSCEMEALGIQELDEDWCEEALLSANKVVNVNVNTNANTNKMPSEKKKQTDITQFFSKGVLFPDI